MGSQADMVDGVEACPDPASVLYDQQLWPHWAPDREPVAALGHRYRRIKHSIPALWKWR